MKPVVSIGLPVCNGERFLTEAIGSLLSQDHHDFELIISDNGSTDKTQEICQCYKERDKRILYYRSDENMGPAWNFNRVFELSHGEYFMWAADDDYWDPTYISSCLDGFNRSKDIILVGTICKSVDAQTGDSYLIDEGFSTVGLRPPERFVQYKSVIHSGRHIGAVFYGLHKRDELRRVMPLRNCIAADHVILAALCFQGEILTVPKLLMVKRWGGTSSSIETTASVLGITNQFFIIFPYLMRELFFQKMILQTDKLTLAEKVRLAVWSWWHYVQLEGRLKSGLLSPRLNSLVGRLPPYVRRYVWAMIHPAASYRTLRSRKW